MRMPTANRQNINENNVPLKAKKHLAISLKGINEGDYAMIMGFPGSTNRYLTQSEVKQRMHSTNEPRIRIRGVRQDVLKKEMAASDKVRIQYASKYAGSSNYWKNSIGMNKAIVDNKVLEAKAEQEAGREAALVCFRDGRVLWESFDSGSEDQVGKLQRKGKLEL